MLDQRPDVEGERLQLHVALAGDGRGEEVEGDGSCHSMTGCLSLLQHLVVGILLSGEKGGGEGVGPQPLAPRGGAVPPPSLHRHQNKGKDKWGSSDH